VDAASLVAAKLCGVNTVYKMGGAQAIAAFTYGTATVRRVEKVIGPGNQYVSAAKRLLYGQVDPGTPAGPSESIIFCDGSADPELAARELLVEAEHGPDSAALLATHVPSLADAVAKLIPGLLDELPAKRRDFCETVLAGYGGIVLTGNLQESVDFINAERTGSKRTERSAVLAWRHEPVANSAKARTVGLAFASEPAVE
jgi:histidinol dehydrogenase